MNIKFVAISVFAVVCVFASDISIAKSNSLSDDQVSQRIIDDSVASYPGTCACPSIPPGTAARAVAAVLEQSWWVLTYLLQERGNKGDG